MYIFLKVVGVPYGRYPILKEDGSIRRSDFDETKYFSDEAINTFWKKYGSKILEDIKELDDENQPDRYKGGCLPHSVMVKCYTDKGREVIEWTRAALAKALKEAPEKTFDVEPPRSKS